MSTLATIAIVAGALIVVALLVSYVSRLRTERARRDGRLAVDAEGYRGAANARRRHANELAARSTRASVRAREFEQEARRLDEAAAGEVQAAQLAEERVGEADRKRKRRLPFFRAARD